MSDLKNTTDKFQFIKRKLKYTRYYIQFWQNGHEKFYQFIQ